MSTPPVTAHPGHCYRLSDGRLVVVRRPLDDRRVEYRANGDLSGATAVIVTREEWAALGPRLAS
jgi:hypothetical protein